MLLLPKPGGFGSSQTNVSRPSTGSFGTSITPSGTAHVKGNWSSSFFTLTNDSYGLYLVFNNQLAQVNGLIDIGVDNAGGTSYSVVIPNLLVHANGTYSGPNSFWFFPLFIKAGSTIAARIQVASTSVTAARVVATSFQQPVNPDSIWCGKVVEALGVDTSTSQGTVVTPGTVSEGAWTLLGSPTMRCCWWQLGIGCSDTTMSAVCYHSDLGRGDGTNNQLIISDMLAVANAGEQLSQALAYPCWGDVLPGSNVYGRSWCSGTADSGISLAAYGVAG